MIPGDEYFGFDPNAFVQRLIEETGRLACMGTGRKQDRQGRAGMEYMLSCLQGPSPKPGARGQATIPASTVGDVTDEDYEATNSEPGCWDLLRRARVRASSPWVHLLSTYAAEILGSSQDGAIDTSESAHFSQAEEWNEVAGLRARLDAKNLGSPIAPYRCLHHP